MNINKYENYSELQIRNFNNSNLDYNYIVDDSVNSRNTQGVNYNSNQSKSHILSQNNNMQLDKNKYNNNSSIQNKPTISQNRTNSINSSQNFNKMSIDLLNKSNINKNNYNNMNINKNNMNKNNIVFNYLNTLTNFTTNKPMKINFKSNTNIESNCLIQPNNDYKNFMMNNNNDKSSNNGQTYLQYKLSSYQNRMNNNNTSNSNSNSIKSGSSSSSYSYNFNSNNIDHHVRKGSYNSTLMKEGFINESNKFCYGSSSTSYLEMNKNGYMLKNDNNINKYYDNTTITNNNSNLNKNNVNNKNNNNISDYNNIENKFRGNRMSKYYQKLDTNKNNLQSQNQYNEFIENTKETISSYPMKNGNAKDLNKLVNKRYIDKQLENNDNTSYSYSQLFSNHQNNNFVPNNQRFNAKPITQNESTKTKNNNSQTIIYNKNKMKNSNNNIFIDQDEYLTHAHMYRAKDNNFYPKLPNKTPSQHKNIEMNKISNSYISISL
ncbi:hypothetical protein LY90DRAFT_675354 [Neocallimastix californiae]|uniref:Uncharacterized protein n=1 Tax=Neocallimastix californiae TaxID=1754190 RepID=A0A1Y2AN77_9FUNG|nr:hypothetical protein LY90DRAFT_675354 [Neocallimastix californiae]|eukprot:ORY23962.1 hypothetical protein LY90DRAFT_675354 [Neocallimastix californiae]